MVFEKVANALPKGAKYEVIWLQTKFVECRPLVYTRNCLDLESIVLFVLVEGGVPVLSLELYLYKSKDLLTVFVSKADTSGYSKTKFSSLFVVSAVLNECFTRFGSTHVRLCLFAKSLPQYLFLGSEHNKSKHILSDADLVKWWVKCMHFLDVQNASGKLLIPGLDKESTKRYLPLTESSVEWSVGTVFNDELLALNTIPRFPDDPKTRFLTSLVNSNRAKEVKTERYILELQSRQEFRLSKAVGLLGLEGRIKGQNMDVLHAVSRAEMEVAKDLLLNIDFASLETAELQSKRFLNFCFQETVTGTLVREKPVKTEPVVNNLSTIVRKKRKTK